MNVCTTSKQELLGWPEEGYNLCPGYMPATVIVITTLYCLTFVASVLSNGFLIFALSQTSRSLQCRNYIVVSQCVSDLLVTLLCMPDTMVSRLTASWHLGEAWCRASPLLHVLAVAASTYSLMMLSLDRCLAMKSPKMFNQGERSRVAVRMTVAVWVAAAAVASPLVFAFQLVPAGGGGAAEVCAERWPWPLAGRLYRAALLLLVIVAPCGVVAVCHTLVSRNLRTANSLATGERRPTGGAQNSVIIMSRNAHAGLTPKVVQRDDSDDASLELVRLRTDGSGGGRRSGRARLGGRRSPGERPPRCRPPLLRSTSSYSLKTRQQLANTLVVLVVVFAACWLPFTLAGLAHLAYASRPTALVMPFALLLGHAHSAVNPVVYSLVHRASLTQVQRSLRVPRLRAAGSRWRAALTLLRRPAARRCESPVSSTNLGNLGPFHPRYLPARNLLNVDPAIEERRTSQFFH
ncbi:Cholecystokinin receptor type A [Amphibalanus amphitrite]|uniref:Cholecystokinin receptor type A n=1 Tax=Amphibalanus amphitrite TaxID=1232801 RepID=A0A6A4WMN5_AMPAM|nr:gastrin/cholecystokinin type B receptor-like [Amphibalanus amphitrite]KAF0289401.1 Cholecystokinin receptor type A [Amphibalanus amphitrite]KAF0307323.1 Cholecystokinin receptor type A [Amphibalanus amphitrite]